MRDVLVASGNNSAHARGFGLFRQCADDVVGFHVIHHQDRPAHALDGFMQCRDLAGQVIRHRWAMRLVFGINIVPEGFPLGIEDAGAIIGWVILMQAAQHVEHAVDGPRWFVVPVAQVGQGMECTIKVRRSVYQQ